MISIKKILIQQEGINVFYTIDKIFKTGIDFNSINTISGKLSINPRIGCFFGIFLILMLSLLELMTCQQHNIVIL